MWGTIWEGEIDMRRWITIGLCLAFLFVFTGCGLFSKKAPAEKLQSTAQEEGTTQDQAAGEEKAGIDGQNTTDTTGGNVKMINIKLYFANEDNSAVLSEKREVPVKDGAILRAAIEALLEGPKAEGLRKTIPDGTRLLGIKRVDNVAVVDFSKEYGTANDIAEVVERVSIVNTLTEIKGVEKVKILVEGKDLVGPSGKPFGELGRVALDAEGKPVPGEKKTITLYFGNSNADKVVAEKREVTLTKGEQLEKIIFEELMKGPKKKGSQPVIPNGTKLISVSTKDGICKLNLSDEFVENHSGGTAGEAMTVYSIVNSLTELSTVKKVQFLIDGKVREWYLHLTFSEPFARNTEIIQK